MKVEKGYYADGEDSYEMTKFIKPEVESTLMRKVVQPLISEYPGAIYPLVEYPEYITQAKRKDTGDTEVKEVDEEVDKAKKNKKKRKKKK